MPEVKTFQQASEPNDLTPGTKWYHDNGKAYIRKSDLSWNYIGEWELPNFHHLHLEGGSMLGSIGGAHGLCHSHNPAFTGTATLNDVDLADKQWTSDQFKNLRTILENYISGKIGGSSGNLSIGNNLAIGFNAPGTDIPHGGTIPLPVYSDGKRASKNEVCGVIVSFSKNLTPNHPHNAFNGMSTCSVDANLVVTAIWHISGGGWDGDHGQYVGAANYLILCKR